MHLKYRTYPIFKKKNCYILTLFIHSHLFKYLLWLIYVWKHSLVIKILLDWCIHMCEMYLCIAVQMSWYYISFLCNELMTLVYELSFSHYRIQSLSLKTTQNPTKSQSMLPWAYGRVFFRIIMLLESINLFKRITNTVLDISNRLINMELSYITLYLPVVVVGIIIPTYSRLHPRIANAVDDGTI